MSAVLEPVGVIAAPLGAYHTINPLVTAFPAASLTNAVAVIVSPSRRVADRDWSIETVTVAGTAVGVVSGPARFLSEHAAALMVRVMIEDAVMILFMLIILLDQRTEGTRIVSSKKSDETQRSQPVMALTSHRYDPPARFICGGNASVVSRVSCASTTLPS